MKYFLDQIGKYFDHIEVRDFKDDGIKMVFLYDDIDSPIYAVSYDYQGPFDDYYGLGTISKFEDQFCFCCQDAAKKDYSSPEIIFKMLMKLMRADVIKTEHKASVIRDFKEAPKYKLI